jgi:hypothetical protein
MRVVEKMSKSTLEDSELNVGHQNGLDPFKFHILVLGPLDS